MCVVWWGMAIMIWSEVKAVAWITVSTLFSVHVTEDLNGGGGTVGSPYVF